MDISSPSPERAERDFLHHLPKAVGEFLRRSTDRGGAVLQEEFRSFGPEYETYVVSIGSELYENPLKIAVGIPRSIDPDASVRDTPHDPNLLAFEREEDAFHRMLPCLINTHAAMFVAVCDGQVIDQDEDEFVLASRTYRKHGTQFILIRQVTEKGPRDDHLSSPEGETA